MTFFGFTVCFLPSWVGSKIGQGRMALKPCFTSVSVGEKSEGNTDLPNTFTLLFLVLRKTISPNTASKCQLGEGFPKESGEKRKPGTLPRIRKTERGLCQKAPIWSSHLCIYLVAASNHHSPMFFFTPKKSHSNTFIF